jgi:nucleoid DNA-binding protein
MVDSVFSAMRKSLIEGDRIEIRGFGVFQVKDTRPKPAARNPRTGDIIFVPARRKTHFKPGKLLKEALHRPMRRVARPTP